MNQWWYSADGKKLGPVHEDKMRDKISSGQITPGTFMWTSGMGAWKRLSDLADKFPEQDRLPPDLPEELVPEAVEEDPPAGANRRIFARAIDLSICCIPGIAAFALFYKSFFRYLVNNVQPEKMMGVAYLVGLGIVLSGFIVSAICASIFGNTPGKALLKIRVSRAQDDADLSFSEYLTRDLNVWLRGFAMGLPLICLIVAAVQMRRLIKKGSTSYDQGQHRVYGGAVGLGRYFLAAVLLVSVFTMQVASNAAFEKMGQDLGAQIAWERQARKDEAEQKPNPFDQFDRPATGTSSRQEPAVQAVQPAPKMPTPEERKPLFIEELGKDVNGAARTLRDVEKSDNELRRDYKVMSPAYAMQQAAEIDSQYARFENANRYIRTKQGTALADAIAQNRMVLSAIYHEVEAGIR